MTMMKQILTSIACVLASGLLAGCASTSRVAQYESSDGNSLDIQVKRTSGAVSDKIVLVVDGVDVGQGSVNYVKTSDVISATVNGYLVEAQCFITEGAVNTGLACDLFVDGEEAGVIRL